MARMIEEIGDRPHFPSEVRFRGQRKMGSVPDFLRMAPMKTRFTEAFGMKHPIACAPMAYVTGGRLAAAVSNAGGLGVLAGGYAGTVGGEPDLAAEIAIA